MTDTFAVVVVVVVEAPSQVLELYAPKYIILNVPTNYTITIYPPITSSFINCYIDKCFKDFVN